MSQHLDVIISSTADDLREYRAAVEDAILGFNLHPIMMERFPSEDRTAVEVCRREVERAEILIGIYAHRYGWVPKPEDGGDGTSSITVLEYEWAGERGIPRLCFLIDPAQPWPHTPPHVDEDPAKHVLLEQFKQRVSSKIRSTFTTPEDLASKVKDALYRIVLEMTGTAPEATAWRAPQPPSISADRRFVGRAKDIEAVRALLQPGATVSITASVSGAGGIGKTYLAYHIANVLKNEFRGGVLLVTLGPDARPKSKPGDPEYDDELKRVVESVVNRALPDWAQAHPEGRQLLAADPAAISPEKVKRWLKDAPGRLLVIMDDVWHDAPARALRALLPDGTAVLVTTRDRKLNLGGKICDLDKFLPEDARAMLTDRLSYLGDLTPYTARLDELAERLGGHALALEIAAANIAINGLAHLPQYLADIESAMITASPFNDLTLEFGDTAREKSVEVTLAFSYDPLPETQKTRFRALGAFPPELDYDERAVLAVWDVIVTPTERNGGPPLDAASAAEKLAAEKAARDDLLALYQRGLVRRDEKTGRYRQHALLRVYAEALARRAGELGDCQARYILHVIYGVTRQFDHLPAEDWETVIMPDQEHIHLMGETLAADIQVLLGTRTIESLAQPTPPPNLVALREELGRIVLPKAFSPDDAIKALKDLAVLRLGEDFAAAVRHYVFHRRVGEAGQHWLWTGLACARLIEDRNRERLFTNELAVWHSNRGQPQAALDYNQASLAISRAQGDKWNEAATLNNIATVYNAIGQPHRALEYHQQALPIRRAVGDRNGEAATFNNLGLVYHVLGQQQRALEHYEQALPITREVGDRAGEAATLNNIGGVYDDLGQKERALEYYEQALTIRRAVRDRAGEATTLNNIGGLYQALGQLTRALELYEQALPIRREVGDRPGEAATLNNMAYIYRRQGKVDRAVEIRRQVIEIYRNVGEVAAEAAVLFNLAVVLHESLGQTAEAIDLVTRSVAILEQYQLPQDAAGQPIMGHRAFLAELRGEAPLASAPVPPGLSPVEAQTIADAIVDFVQTPDWNAARAQVERHSLLLLRPAADAVFQVLIDNAPPGTPPQILEMLRQHRAVLTQCREIGVEETFRRLTTNEPRPPAPSQAGPAPSAGAGPSDAELQAIAEAIATFVQTPDWNAARAQVEQRSALLLRPIADEVFGAIIENAPEGTPQEAINMLRQHRAVLASCREVGIAETFRRLASGEFRPPSTASNGGEQEVKAIVEAFITSFQAQTLEEARARIEQHAALLLNPGSDIVFQAIIKGQTDPQLIDMLEQHRAVLALCRELGVAEAFRRLASGDHNLPPLRH